MIDTVNPTIKERIIMPQQPVRVAHILGKMSHGGVESVVMDYFRHIDSSMVQFDFFADSDSAVIPQEQIEALGGRVFIIPPYQKPFSYHKSLVKLLKQNKYKIVHSHINTMNVFPLMAAWRAKVPVRICHNHSTAHKSEGIKACFKFILRPFVRLFATEYFACGEYAGRWMFGNKLFDSGKVRVIKNTIDFERFSFSCNTRKRIKKELVLSGKLVIGHVGRFTQQKNHMFLLEIFREVVKMQQNAMLLLIGDGPLREKIVRQARNYRLEENIIFAGITDRPEDYYCAMDIFVLPSLFEGLPIVAMEAQASGLPVIMSDKITPEANISGKAVFLPLDIPAERWANIILAETLRGRENNIPEETRTYDINVAARDLHRIYEELLDSI